MEKRATFESIKTDDASLFVVKVGGHLGTRQRATVENLVQKCRDNGKSRVIFDLSTLESMGGGVATVLGDFAAELNEKGHAPWFVGASTVVQSFMTARFLKAVPAFAGTIAEARILLDDGPTSGPVTPVTPVTAVTAPQPESKRKTDASGAVEPVRPEPTEPALAETSSAPVSRHDFVTLADAREALLEMGELSKAITVLEGLLHGYGLANICHLFCVDGDRLQWVNAPAGVSDVWLPAEGAVCNILRRRAAPVDLVDLGDVEIDAQETEVISQVNCHMVVPVFQEDQLEGVIFVRKDKAGEDYSSSEQLALDLLARQIGSLLDEGRGRRGRSRSLEEKQLRSQLRRQRTVLRLCRELHSIRDEDQLIGRLLISLIGEMNVTAAVYYAFRGDVLMPEHVYGLEESNSQPLSIAAGDSLDEFEEAIRPEDASEEHWGEAAKTLRKNGMDLLVPLRGKNQLLGVLALAVRRSKDTGNFDADYLQALLHQAGVAAEHARTVTTLEAQMLRVAKTLITLIERRIGTGTTATTELVTYYTGRLAESLSYEPDNVRDLLYGAVLRDVGMIEISDLVLKSPRSLTPEEWKLVQRHPISGVEVLRAMGFSDITCDVVLHHHERFNGEGYPHGLRGAAIPQGARIVSVVESYVAMTRQTPYRPALSQDESLAVLQENWEMRYDPEVIEAFVEIVKDDPSVDTDLAVEQLLTG